MNVLITGANRGIGAGFVRHYLSQGDRVWACYRSNLDDLKQIKNSALTCVQWDVLERPSNSCLASLPNELNLLINNAGVYGSLAGGQQLQTVTAQQMLDVFHVNAIAPINVVQQLLPALKNATKSGNRACIANMSSKMGSVEDNSSGGAYAYRASKSALCNISRSMAHDLAGYGIQVISLHPGWVRTDMTENTGLIDVNESVAGLADVICHTNQYPPGSFIAFDGQTVPY